MYQGAYSPGRSESTAGDTESVCIVATFCKLKYTPGPWRVESRSEGLVVLNADGFAVAKLSGSTYLRPSQRDGNAALLAAAPELLGCCRELHQALEACVVVIRHGGDMTDLKKELRSIPDGFALRAGQILGKATLTKPAPEISVA
jgi:hypothetical protein